MIKIKKLANALNSMVVGAGGGFMVLMHNQLLRTSPTEN